jgi:hypothetical protein
MSKEDGVSGNPGIPVSAPVDRVYQENTAGGGQQKSEKNYQRILDRAVNESPSPTQKK